MAVGKCDIMDIQEGVGVTTNESINTATLAAGGCHWIVVTSEPLVKLLHACLIQLALIVDQVSWHTSDGSHSFISIATIETFVVLIELGICLLEERHPPGTGIRSPGCPWSVSTAPSSGWQSVINIDPDPSVLDVEPETEDTVVVVRFLTHDSVHSLWDF